MPLDSLEDVRLFRQVVASGGVSAAARATHQSKNRVSQRLAALERALGVRLADRDTRTFTLTQEGERFRDAAEALLASAERAELAVAGARAVEGRVRLAVRSAMGGMGLGAELVKLLAAAPGLALQIAVVDENTDLLRDGFDLAVQVGRLVDSDSICQRLNTPNWVLAASPRYLDGHGRPKSPAALVQHQCIRTFSRPRERRWTLAHVSGRRVSAELGGRFECRDAQLQSEVLYEGLGIGLRPPWEVRTAEAAGLLERVLPAWSFAEMPVWLVAPKGRLGLPRVAAVAQVLRRVLNRE